VCAFQALIAQNLAQHEVWRLDAAASLQLLRHQHHLTEEQLREWGLLQAEQELQDACSGLPLALQVIGGALMVPSSNQKEVKQAWKVNCENKPLATWHVPCP
jgi:invasion protein IalB